MKIKNISTGPRGFNAKSGPVMLEKDQEVDVDIEKFELEYAKATGWFDISGSEVEGDKDEIADLQKQAAELKVKVDQRWGAPRLREEIDAALAK